MKRDLSPVAVAPRKGQAQAVSIRVGTADQRATA
jgi:hypothetical protein